MKILYLSCLFHCFFTSFVFVRTLTPHLYASFLGYNCVLSRMERGSLQSFSATTGRVFNFILILASYSLPNLEAWRTLCPFVSTQVAVVGLVKPTYFTFFVYFGITKLAKSRSVVNYCVPSSPHKSSLRLPLSVGRGYHFLVNKVNLEMVGEG